MPVFFMSVRKESNLPFVDTEISKPVTTIE
ncbi:hypothetical protein POX_a01693 [Penicillium oxalicum]|nr:hypothetical protein POX_a01693 [Penicillium oxalicum]KAI2795089.1 hypothetical protein POX_a01693 [Penicillium oxalicum]